MIAFFFLLFSIWLVYHVIREALATHRELLISTRTTGRIKAFVETRGSDGDKVTHALIDFDVDGMSYVCETSRIGDQAVGDIVPILYLAQAPTRNRSLPDKWEYSTGLIFGSIGLAGIICSLGTIFESFFFHLLFPSLY